MSSASRFQKADMVRVAVKNTVILEVDLCGYFSTLRFSGMLVIRGAIAMPKTSPFGRKLPFDPPRKQPIERPLCFGECRKPNTHNSTTGDLGLAVRLGRQCISHLP
jgi:hypothetical protein